MDSKTKTANAVQTPSHASLLSKSATGASILIILQVASRALTFIVNQVLLRYLSPELLGTSTQLEVYSISVLLFSREALRVAIQRQTDVTDDQDGIEKPGQKANGPGGKTAKKTQEVVNLAYLSILMGIFFIFAAAWAYLSSLKSTPLVLNTPYFHQALAIFGVASFLELLAEPCFVVVQQKSQYNIRASAESTATVLRCIVTCGSAILASSRGIDIGVLPFALGQGAYGLTLSLVYYWRIGSISSKDGFSLLPRPIVSKYLVYNLNIETRVLILLLAMMISFCHISPDHCSGLAQASSSRALSSIFSLKEMSSLFHTLPRSKLKASTP
jgi:oligosaccharide translocation protein RFT1